MDTIFATSSGAPPAAIAVLRLSGPHALAAGRMLAMTLPPDRVAGLRALRDPSDGSLLDRALVLVFPGPRTTTGEDVVELHVHGGRAVVMAVEAALTAIPGLRRAEAGEFTRRALANNIIDLTEAEGLGDLLAAETETARRTALLVAEGGLRAKIERWTAQLIAVAAQVEAQLDFSDEGDVADTAADDILSQIEPIRNEITALLAQPPVERLKDGLRVVLAGPPNSGKSTLLNALADREVAIVSPISGTTRDRIEAPVVRDGIAYVLTDTAGLAFAASDPVERIGIERARAAMETADLVLWLGDEPPTDDALWLHARADLPGRGVASPDALAISAATGEGLQELWERIAARVRGMLPTEGAIATNARQRSLLVVCVANLSAISRGDMLVVAEEVRLALRSLDAVSGRGGTEDMLDALFSRFCIGK